MFELQPGYERLCCLRCIQPRDHNFGTTCVCRVPKHLREEKVVECVHCGCGGCASGDWLLLCLSPLFFATIFLLVGSPGMAFVVVTYVVNVGKILGRPIEEGWDLFVFSYDPHEQAMYVKGHLFTDKLKLIEIGNVCNQNSCVFGMPHRFHSVFQNLTVGLLNNKQTWLV